jgi:glycosyltransferase involved in cell wall biosynthesis
MIIVIGTCGRGGILSVIDAIDSSELARSWQMIKVPSHDSLGLVGRLRLAAGAAGRVVSLGLSQRAQVLHLHAAMRGSFWRKAIYLRLGHLFGVPSVLHLHGSEMEDFVAKRGVIGRWLIARTLCSADRVVVLSESWRKFVIDLSPNAKVETVFNFVNVPEIGQVPHRTVGDPLRLAFLGLIGERKGIFDLLKVVGSLEAKRPGCIHLLVGGNGEVDRLRDTVRELGLTHCVEVLGWIDADARRALLTNCHALALPSYNEGLPMALLEAMSYGLPTLTTGVGGIPELVCDGEQGFLVEPGDVDGMVAHLESWIDDEETRKRMGQASRSRVKRDFSAATAVAKLDAVYRAVISERGTRGA